MTPDMFEQLQRNYPYGSHWKSEYDDYVGTVVGWYITREGKLGVDLQLDNARVVHVYNTKNLLMETKP